MIYNLKNMKIIKKQKPFDPNHKYKPGERFILNERTVELKDIKNYLLSRTLLFTWD